MRLCDFSSGNWSRTRQCPGTGRDRNRLSSGGPLALLPDQRSGATKIPQARCLYPDTDVSGSDFGAAAGRVERSGTSQGRVGESHSEADSAHPERSTTAHPERSTTAHPERSRGMGTATKNRSFLDCARNERFRARTQRLPWTAVLLPLALTVLACGPTSTSPATVQATIDRRVVIPDGAALPPDNPSQPGDADPTALVVAHGKLYVTLANLYHYAPAGPSFLGIYDPATLTASAPVSLETNASQCRQAMDMVATDDGLLIACAGKISLSGGHTDDGALVDVGFDGTVRRIVTVGRSPGSVVRIGNDVWLGDGEGGGVSHVSYDNFEVLAGQGGKEMVSLCQESSTKIGFVAGLAAVGGRAFASCFNDDAVQEFDPTTGKTVGNPISVGSGPLKFGLLGDALYVLDNTGGTLSQVLPTAKRAEVYLGGGTQGGDDLEGIAGTSTLAAVTNSAYGTLVFASLTGTPKLVGSIDLKTSPSAGTDYPTAVAYDGSAFYVAIPGLGMDTRPSPSEIVRVVVKP